MARAGCCRCCKRHLATKGHTETCRLKDRPVPERKQRRAPEGELRYVFEVDRTPIHTRGDALMAELFESRKDAA